MSVGTASGTPVGRTFVKAGTLMAGTGISGVATVAGSAVMGYLAGQIIAYPVAPEPGHHISREHDFVSGLEGAVALALIASRFFKL